SMNLLSTYRSRNIAPRSYSKVLAFRRFLLVVVVSRPMIACTIISSDSLEYRPNRPSRVIMMRMRRIERRGVNIRRIFEDEGRRGRNIIDWNGEEGRNTCRSMERLELSCQSD
ncbi:hypothetical protein PFISCL1PPCAC_10807, partial [Pristionchus fissidentatus]